MQSRCNNPRLDEIVKALSRERLQPYVRDGVDIQTGLARYALNMALCEALYPSVHCLEIALRNAIHRRLVIAVGRDDWYVQRDSFSGYQCRMLDEAESKVLDKASRLSRTWASIAPADVVAELPLGFWIAFYNHMQGRNAIALKLLQPVFPYAPKNLAGLMHIGRRTSAFRHLRNRIFHHERILHWKDLAERHRELNETLRWISPELASRCAAHDRFVDVHTAGLRPWL